MLIDLRPEDGVFQQLAMDLRPTPVHVQSQTLASVVPTMAQNVSRYKSSHRDTFSHFYHPVQVVSVQLGSPGT